MKRRHQSLSRIFAAPLAIAAAMIAGLVLGLTDDGPGDLAAWICTAIAPLALTVALLRSRRLPSSQTVQGSP